MNARKSKALRVKARKLATSAPQILGGHWVGERHVPAKHADGTYRRIYQDLKRAA